MNKQNEKFYALYKEFRQRFKKVTLNYLLSTCRGSDYCGDQFLENEENGLIFALEFIEQNGDTYEVPEQFIVDLERYVKDAKSITEEEMEILGLPICELDLSVLTYNALMLYNIPTVFDLTKMSAQELLGLRKFSRKCLENVKEALAKIGLKLCDA